MRKGEGIDDGKPTRCSFLTGAAAAARSRMVDHKGRALVEEGMAGSSCGRENSPRLRDRELERRRYLKWAMNMKGADVWDKKSKRLLNILRDLGGIVKKNGVDKKLSFWSKPPPSFSHRLIAKPSHALHEGCGFGIRLYGINDWLGRAITTAPQAKGSPITRSAKAIGSPSLWGPHAIVLLSGKIAWPGEQSHYHRTIASLSACGALGTSYMISTPRGRAQLTSKAIMKSAS